MLSGRNTITSVDDYIKQFPPDIRKKLKQLRGIILNAAPDCEEGISYQMPVYKQNGVLVYFGAFKNHIGFFPTASGISEFKKELSGYKLSKGTIQIPNEKPIPINLIKRIVKFRINKNSKKLKAKKK